MLATGSPELLGVSQDGSVQVPGLVGDTYQSLVMTIELFPSSQCQPFQILRDFQRLVEVIVQLVFELIV